MEQEYKIGVLYTDYVDSENYHIMEKRAVVKSVMVHDRRADGMVYNQLYAWMVKLRLNALWVFPDTQLSLWLNRGDFSLINKEEIDWWAPGKKPGEVRPPGIRLDKRHLFFPAHMSICNDTEHDRQLKFPVKDTLYNTVDYVQRVSNGTPFLWSPGYMAIRELREIHSHNIVYKELEPFQKKEVWNEAIKKMVPRPSWSKRKRDGSKGLSEDDKDKAWIIGYDKNSQFLGAASTLVLANGDYMEVSGEDIGTGKIGFWEYELQDVSDTEFNGFELYCPLSRKYTWASTNLLLFARKLGIKFSIKRGIVWKQNVGRGLETWSKRLWEQRVMLGHEERFPDILAAKNAQQITKMKYLEMIGRFCNEYSKEYYQPQWNEGIVHQAITNQGYTIEKRIREHGVKPVLVSNDSFYITTDDDSPGSAYANILDYTNELRGYKFKGMCRLDSDIIDAFESKDMTALKLEALLKGKFEKYATAR